MSHETPTVDTQSFETPFTYPTIASFISPPFAFHSSSPAFIINSSPCLSAPAIHRFLFIHFFHLPGCYSYVIWFTTRSFLFPQGFLNVRSHPRSSIPHQIVGLNSVLIDPLPALFLLIHPLLSIGFYTTLSYPVPLTDPVSLFFPYPSRCVSHQTSLTVFGAFGRTCSSYHRARKYATSILKTTLMGSENNAKNPLPVSNYECHLKSNVTPTDTELMELSSVVMVQGSPVTS